MTDVESSWTYQSTRTVFKFLLVLSDALGLAALGLLLAWIIIYNNGFSWFSPNGLVSFHVFFMVTFLLIFQANASLVYRQLPGNPKYFNKLIHAGLHFGTCIGLTFGLVAILQFHENVGDPNITSLHSWIGITTIACYYAQFVFGFFVYLFPLGSNDIKIFTLPVHKMIGRTLLVLVGLTIISGIMMESGDSTGQALLLLNLGGFFVALFVAIVLYLLADFNFRRSPLQPHGISVREGQRIFYGATTSTPRFIPSPSRGFREFEKPVVY